jgi:CHAT domain
LGEACARRSEGLNGTGAELPGIVGAYDEVKVRIERGEGGAHRVLANSSVGEAAGSFELPFGELELENFVLRVSRPRGRRRIDSTATSEAKQFGGQLFEAMFRGHVRDLFREALANARAEGHGLRVTLCLSGAPELMDVPWEYLYDEPNFLSVSAFTPVIRYLDLPRGYRPLHVDPPLRILAMVSSPSDYVRLDTERERANVERAVRPLTEKGAVKVDWLERATLTSLLRKLQSDTFHVLHYVGHGSYHPQSEEGQLLFEDENGLGRPVSGDKLGTLLNDFTSLRLAVLNACEGARTSRTDPFSGVAASLVQRDIPAVIAMQFEITDVAAVVFAEGFYHALASGSPVDASLAAARLAIFAERSDDIEWGTPVLFMRVADGRIFNVPEPVVAPLEPLASEQPLVTAPAPEDAVEQPAVRLVGSPVVAQSSAASGVPALDDRDPAAPRVPKPPVAPHGRRGPLAMLGALAVLLLAAGFAVLILVTSGGGVRRPAPGPVSPPGVVTKHNASVTSGPRTAHSESSTSAQTTPPSTKGSKDTLRPCDQNISANPETSCPFATNTFYEYWQATGGNLQPGDQSVRVWSPVTQQTYTQVCTNDGTEVHCTHGQGDEVRFNRVSVAAYTRSNAAAYAASGKLGP